MVSAFHSRQQSSAKASALSAGTPRYGSSELGSGAVAALSMKWSALHDAAAVVASLAGYPPEACKAEVRNFPALARDAGGWRYDEARRGVDDLAAMMEPGLAALLAVHALGLSAGPAAHALWHEFVAARADLLELVAPQGVKRLG